MKHPTWPKAFAFIGLAIMGLTVAYYATAIATGGVAARILGTDLSGDTLLLGSVVLIVGIATAAAFGFLAATNVRNLTRRT